MVDQALPPGTYEAADEAFEAYRVGDDGPRDELEAALLAAEPFIRADERERIAKLAGERRAHYPADGQWASADLRWKPELRAFADLIREPT